MRLGVDPEITLPVMISIGKTMLNTGESYKIYMGNFNIVTRTVEAGTRYNYKIFKPFWYAFSRPGDAGQRKTAADLRLHSGDRRVHTAGAGYGYFTTGSPPTCK
jgi:hypothetical protein